MNALAESPGATVSLIGEPEARLLVDEIKAGMDGVRERVFRLHEGEGWRALGYRSWRACVTAEFPQHVRTLYKHLEAAKVERNVCPIGHNSEPLPESHARELSKLKEPEKQREAWAKAVGTAPKGKVTAKHVAEVVRRHSPPESPSDKATEEDGEDDTETPPVKEAPRPRPEMWWTCPVCSVEFNLESSTAQGWVRRRFCGDCNGHSEPERPERAAPSIARLQAIHEARMADTSLQNWASIQANLEKQLSSPEMRKVIFLAKGGDLALLRLGLPWNVTGVDLKQAFRDAARIAHPDKGGTADEFRELQRDRDLVAQMLGEDQ